MMNGLSISFIITDNVYNLNCLINIENKMIMKYKEKIASTNKVIIYLRYLDSGKYFPLIRVVDLEDNLILEKDLPETRSLDVIGTIQLSAKKVTIKPRKNAFFELYEAMSFDL